MKTTVKRTFVVLLIGMLASPVWAGKGGSGRSMMNAGAGSGSQSLVKTQQHYRDQQQYQHNNQDRINSSGPSAAGQGGQLRTQQQMRDPFSHGISGAGSTTGSE